MDVFESEPLSVDSALWNKPNVIVTPHVSAMSHGDQVAQLFISNLDLFVFGVLGNVLII